jgi:hypothetical protein
VLNHPGDQVQVLIKVLVLLKSVLAFILISTVTALIVRWVPGQAKLAPYGPGR